MDEIAELRKCILFQELTDQELGTITQLMSTDAESFMPGETICQIDAPGDSMYLVKSGKVQIFLPGDPDKIVLAELGSGKFFGEMSLLDKSPRSANVAALEQTEIFVLTRKHVAYLLEKEPKIAAKVMIALARVLSARIRVLNERIQSALSSE
ncbi:MAG TPA: transcriptional regulator [candidate division Zixibacteria bacterium]|jgi:CRP/FNR family cyclic AMP-dependent transcriptional regulator|nr:transcriptional regulator [candidate division Zixibacteria bacterium]